MLIYLFFLMIRHPPRSTPFPTRRSSDLAILHAQNKSAGSKQWSQRTRGRCVVCRLHTEKNNLRAAHRDRKSTRLNSSHANISYAVFCLKKKKKKNKNTT